MKSFTFILTVVASLLLASCGSSQTPGPSSVTYTIGGTVSGLSGTGLVLQDNGGNNLPVSASGSFTFTTAIASGGAYSVTVLTQPSTPAQTCVVTSGSGTASANVTSVQVTCTTYTIGGTVSGLSGTGLVLRNNGANNLPVSANGSFTFTTAIASGGAYNVTVLTQPSSPAQTCVVASGSGTASANVTSVQVTCSTATYTIGGTVINLAGTGGGLQLQDNGTDSLLVNANGTFTFATALLSGSANSVSVSVQPSSPAQTCVVRNGAGTATANVTSVVVDCGVKEWTWVNGANVINQKGTYGTPGKASASNVPGARWAAITWTDAAWNFWLFGGTGLDSAGTVGDLNDLWEYSAGQWTWMGGSNVINQQGIYGSLGTAAAGNVPGARARSVSWTDTAGNFWLFGGVGYDAGGGLSYLNDLWKYSGGQWTWMGGSNVVNQPGTYGSLGTAAAGNIPGGREGGSTWTDAAGNFWLFGGTSSAGGAVYLNDLWEYSAGQWTWMGGSNLAGQKGTYGTPGTPAAGNIPGARFRAITWTDAGNLWLFGGYGYDSTGTLGSSTSILNDLWKYTTSTGQWTWMGGSNVINQPGTYGTKGTAAAGNIPGARVDPVKWIDVAGNFWLFGGDGVDSSAGTYGHLNDLWKYSAGQWTWMGGSNIVAQAGTYGTQGIAAAGNIPGGRVTAVNWTDAAGNFWLFGGYGIDSGDVTFYLNDLWKYVP